MTLGNTGYRADPTPHVCLRRSAYFTTVLQALKWLECEEIWEWRQQLPALLLCSNADEDYSQVTQWNTQYIATETCIRAISGHFSLQCGLIMRLLVLRREVHVGQQVELAARQSMSQWPGASCHTWGGLGS
eukprot:2433857-Amphidinium_carterae.1